MIRAQGDNCADFRAAIVAALGTAPDQIEPGRLHRFSTNGKRGDTSGWCFLFEDGRAGEFGDFRAGLSSRWAARQREPMNPAQRVALAHQMRQARAQRADARCRAWAEASGRLARLWASCKPVAGDGSGADPVSLYLRHRLALAPGESLAVPECLRLHPGLEYHQDAKPAGRWPAMVAALQSPTGATVALHRTWLTLDGRKAPVPGPVKKLSPACGPIMGASIRLAVPDAGRLGIAEGIETALAARCASGLPTVAAYSAGALAVWQWPRDLRRLVIFADADPAGAEAAETLRQRARRAGLSADVMTPTTPGHDWCDVWAQRNVKGCAE